MGGLYLFMVDLIDKGLDAVVTGNIATEPAK